VPVSGAIDGDRQRLTEALRRASGRPQFLAALTAAIERELADTLRAAERPCDRRRTRPIDESSPAIRR
jgi:hypothetical protein